MPWFFAAISSVSNVHWTAWHGQCPLVWPGMDSVHWYGLAWTVSTGMAWHGQCRLVWPGMDSVDWYGLARVDLVLLDGVRRP